MYLSPHWVSQSGFVSHHEDKVAEFKRIIEESDTQDGVVSPVKAGMEAKPLLSPDRARFVPPVASTTRKSKVKMVGEH